MGRRKFTSEVAREVATLATNGEAAKIKVDQYKSGKKKGEYYIDYTHTANDVKASFVAKVLNDAADYLDKGDDFDLKVMKEPNDPGFGALALKAGAKA